MLARLRRVCKGFGYSGLGRDRWQRPGSVMEALPVSNGARVADIGAGGGYFTRHLVRATGASGRVYSVDTDPDMVLLLTEQAARNQWSTVVPVAADPYDPRLPEQVDLALMVDAFHHLPEPATYLSTLAGHLRTGGRVAVIEPYPRWYLFGHATEPTEIRQVMTQAGYRLITTHTFLPRQSFQLFSPA